MHDTVSARNPDIKFDICESPSLEPLRYRLHNSYDPKYKVTPGTVPANAGRKPRYNAGSPVRRISVYPLVLGTPPPFCTCMRTLYVSMGWRRHRVTTPAAAEASSKVPKSFCDAMKTIISGSCCLMGHTQICDTFFSDSSCLSSSVVRSYAKTCITSVVLAASDSEQA
jgi:hypothetical protein